jgi:hypothetical protein
MLRPRPRLIGSVGVAVLIGAAFVAWGPAGISNAVTGGGATRTWVSGTGDDVNPCSRTAPCKTFAGAISKTAAGGQISVIDSGGFGAVTINKAITIDATGVEAGILATAGSNGVTVNAGPLDDVVLKGVDIFGGSQCGNSSSTSEGQYGVRYIGGRSLTIEHSTIEAFSKAGISVEPGSNNAQLAVHGATIRNNCGAGIKVAPGATGVVTASVSASALVHNLVGYLANSGRSTVSDSQVLGSTQTGVNASNAAADLTVTGTTISGSTTGAGVLADNGGKVHVTGSTITNNRYGFSLSGGSIESAGDNSVLGNTSNGFPSSTTPRI